MKHYKIHVALSGYIGAKTGTEYHCTAGAVIEAEEGEFKDLPQEQYSLFGSDADGQEAPSPEDEA